MPRPRAFDTATALEAARDTFWRLGYESTTLTDLTDAMGISRPSLYNAFGDKEALFLSVLEAYVADYAPALAAMDEEPNGRAAIGAFLTGAARALAQTPGCLRVGHTATSGPHAPRLAEALAHAHEAFEAAFEARLARAQHEGQLDPAEDTAALAAFFAGIVSAMATRSRLSDDPVVLVGMAKRAMRAWL